MQSVVQLTMLLLLSNYVSAQEETPPVCLQNVTPITAEFDENGGPGEINVTTEATCAWTATTNSLWLMINQPTIPMLGSGTVEYAVSLNSSLAARTDTLTVAGQVITIEQAGVVCDYAFASNSVTATAAAGSGEVSMTTKFPCPWNLAGGTDWLTLTSSETGTGPTTLTYNFTENPLTIPRSGTFVLNEHILTITQAGQPTCPVNLGFTEVNAPYLGEVAQLDISTEPTCNWSPQSLVPWLTITEVTSSDGAGSGQVTYQVATNDTGSVRQGRIVVADQTLTVIQPPEPSADCDIASLAVSDAQYSANFQMGNVLLEAPVNCNWTAHSNAEWLTLANSSASGRGPQQIVYLVEANASDSARVGSLTIAGLPLFITQQARQCTASLNSSVIEHPADASQSELALTISEHCDWTVNSDAPWLTVLNSSRQGQGASTIHYFVEANNSGEARNASLNVAGQVFTVTQTAEEQCNITLNAAAEQHPATASQGRINISAAAECQWQANSTVPWLIITQVDSASGQVEYQVLDNPTVQARTGTITIAEQTFTVTQDAAPQTDVPDPNPTEEEGAEPNQPTAPTQCIPELTTTTATHGAGQESGLIQVNIAAGCSWRVTSNETWVQLEAPDIAISAFSYLLTANINATERHATLTILAADGEQSVTLNQAAGEVQYTLTINLLPVLGGTVKLLDDTAEQVCNSTQCQFEYPAGTPLSLAAQSNNGWQFEEWLNCTEIDNLCGLTLTADTIVSAQFDQVLRGYIINNTVEPQQQGHLQVDGQVLTQDGIGVSDLEVQLSVTALADDTFMVERTIRTDEFGRYVFNNLTDFIPGNTYSVVVSTLDPQNNRTNTSNTVTFPTQAFTKLSLDLNSTTILNNDVISLAGKLSRFPAAAVDLSELPLELTIIAPDGQVEVMPLTTDTDTGQYKLTEVGGFDQAGTYTLQATFAGTTDLDAAVSEPQVLLVGSSAGYVLLVQGRIANGEGLAAHNKTVQRIYQRLKNRGFEDDNILYFNYDPRQTGVDGIPSKTAIRAAFDTLQDRLNGSPAPFYLIMINHGGIGGNFYIDDGNGAQISPPELGGWLDDFELGLSNAAFTDYPRIIMLGACYSGNFIPELSGRGRVIITSAAADEVSFKGPEESDGIRSGEFFMEELFHRLERGDSLKQAFEFATTRTEIYTRRQGQSTANSLRRFHDNAIQHPLLDDNGDRVGSNVLNILQVGSPLQQDGSVYADSLYLGVSRRVDTNFAGQPADILSVTDTLWLDAATEVASLTLTVNDADRVDSAVADIRLPSTTLTLEAREYTEQLEIRDLPREFLSCDKSQQCSVTTEAVFTEPGQYEVFYFVRDTLTETISPLQRSLVYKNHPTNRPPRPFNLIAPRDNATPQTVLLFDWRESQDPDADPLTYTLQIAADQDMAQLVYQQQELTGTSTFIDANTWVTTADGVRQRGLQDQTEYFWRVIAVDIFGAQTASPIWQFITDNPNAQPGIHTAYFDSLLPELPLEEVEVEVVFDVPTIAESVEIDQHLAVLPEGTHQMTVTAPGFAPTEAVISVTSGQVTEANVVLQPLTQISLTERVLQLPTVAVSGLGGFQVTLRGNADLSELTLEAFTPVRLGSQRVVAQFSLESGRLLINDLMVVETEDRYQVVLEWVRDTDPMVFTVVEVNRVD